jgi:CRISPR/Cas system CSM-associated protein Csm3 (group 7 of RAMP superfamily)
MESKEGEFRELDLIYTESKWENLIDRTTSRAQHPRQTERVPQGAEFDCQMVFNLMEKRRKRFGYLVSGIFYWKMIIWEEVVREVTDVLNSGIWKSALKQ